MNMAITSLAGVFLIIAMGYALKRLSIINEAAFAGFERITYLVFFPAVIIQTLAMANLAGTPLFGVAAALVGAILIVAGSLTLLRPFLHKIGIDGPAYTSIFQGATRWNTFVAISLAGSLFGSQGLALMAVAVAAMVPLLNVMCVSVLVRHASGARIPVLALIKTILANPFVWSCIVGLMLHPFVQHIPDFMKLSLDIVARAALAAGLVVVGAGLELSRLRKPGLATMLAVVLKLIAMPLLAFMLARMLGVQGVALQTVMIAAAVPTATAAYILARQMGGDAKLMAEITTIQTLLSMLTLPAFLLLSE
ncbi:MAG: AEC family transporter [Bosea sp. (in: a-proteobacteria)]